MSYGMDGWNKPGGDLISRQDAIDLLDEQIAICNRALTNPSISMNDEFAVNVERNSLMAYRDKLECMPSAQPERMRGTWIIKDNPGTGWYRVTCSECGEDVTSTAPCIGFYPNAKVTWDYCPNCGADMREVDDERV